MNQQEIDKLWEKLNPAERALATSLIDPQPTQRLLDFTLYTYPQYNPEPAHALIASTLDAVVNRELNRVIICAPPQHGKSELTSVRLPAFWLGRRPNDPVILASYAASLAEDKSRQVRQIVESEEFTKLFPGIRTRDDSRAVGLWQLDGYRGKMVSVGAGGPITGHGAMLAIVDDIYENWETSQSPTIRDKVWNWYRTTFRTRVWEGGAIVIIMTRWNSADLIGQILNDKRASDWHILRLAAISETQEIRDHNNRAYNLPNGLPDPLGREPGQPLTPERYSIKALEEFKDDVGFLAWNAEYQGAPTTEEGNRFKRGWFRVVDEAPMECKRVRYWDKAATQGGGDYTVGLLMAYDEEENKVYIEDVVRGQWSIGQRDRVILETAHDDYDTHDFEVAIWGEQEPGSGGKESADNFMKMLAGFPAHIEKVTGKKEVRAEPFAAAAEAGNVFLVRGKWNADYLDELGAFPNGTHDDQVDTSSGAYNKLVVAKPKKRLVSY